MSREYLRHKVDENVVLWGCEENGDLLGVMGIQDVQDVTLIRHAYVRTAHRNQGIGGKLIGHLKALASRPLLVGTRAAATWAIWFYGKHGFRAGLLEKRRSGCLSTGRSLSTRQRRPSSWRTGSGLRRKTGESESLFYKLLGNGPTST